MRDPGGDEPAPAGAAVSSLLALLLHLFECMKALKGLENAQLQLLLLL